MNEKPVIVTIDNEGVARITMNRPDLRNAFNEELINEICNAMGRLNGDAGVRAIVLTGAGKAFSAGADLNMMRRAGGYSFTENRDDARRLAHMLTSIYESPKPTVALVNGPAMGGGLGLVAACDIAIGSEDAFFALSEVRLGLIPAVISPFVIHAIGERAARRFFITAERFTAREAQTMGLLHIVAPAGEINDRLAEILKALSACGPNAIRAAKELIRAVGEKPINEKLMRDVADRIAKARAGDEGKEGIAAFLEKRKAAWVKDA